MSVFLLAVSIRPSVFTLTGMMSLQSSGPVIDLSTCCFKTIRSQSVEAGDADAHWRGESLCRVTGSTHQSTGSQEESCRQLVSQTD